MPRPFHDESIITTSFLRGNCLFRFFLHFPVKKAKGNRLPVRQAVDSQYSAASAAQAVFLLKRLPTSMKATNTIRYQKLPIR